MNGKRVFYFLPDPFADFFDRALLADAFGAVFFAGFAAGFAAGFTADLAVVRCVCDAAFLEGPPADGSWKPRTKSKPSETGRYVQISDTRT